MELGKYEKRHEDDIEKRTVYELMALGDHDIHIGIFESEENARKYSKEIGEQKLYKGYLFEVYNRPYFKDIYFKD